MVRIFLGAIIVCVFFPAFLYFLVCSYGKSALAAVEKPAIKKKFHLIHLLRF